MTEPEDALFERHAEFCKMFSNPKRLRILDLLKDDERTVSEISDETGIAQPTVSQHLRKMRDQGVVTKRDEGRNNYYGIADDRIIDAMTTMREVLLDQLADDAAVSNR
ncbi:ArsR/SmtB family transcription factor [Halobacterium hubeiense]|uniref:ArsR/SmtB family transcription factor n=1 Tax=Halobacterium hubeiense TaxID=1407499 RepID=UPI003C75ED05